MNRKRASYGRTTITVPRDLKRRMKAVRDSVNWSAVAGNAFEAKLRELSRKEESKTMQDVVKRLRKLKEEQAGNESFRTGETEGRNWAMNAATPDQLERLETFRSQMSSGDWNGLFETEEGWRELARQIEPRTAAKSPSRRGKEKSFWREIIDETNISDMGFFRGFTEGALAVWQEVRDQL